MKKIILIILAVLIFSGIGYAQVNNLTDRELLIQLTEKVNYINDGMLRMESRFNQTINKFDAVDNKISAVENRVTLTEANLSSLCGKIEDLTGIWYWVLGLFGVLVISIIVYVWKGIYENREKNHKTD